MWIKICGLRTPETVDAAVAAGADAVGFVFAPGSPRSIQPDSARALVARVPEGVETVGVFRDQPVDVIVRAAREAGVTTVQMHGHEGPGDFEAVRRAGFGVIRAISAATFVEESQDHEGAGHDSAPDHLSKWQPSRLLLDAPDPGAGRAFAESTLAATSPPEGWILAGGLTVENVARLVATLTPGGVDVSSGVEATRGVKSSDLIREFVAAARGPQLTVGGVEGSSVGDVIETAGP